MSDRFTSLCSSYEAALARLEDVLTKPRDEYMRDSAIQRFEFTFELFWKTLKARLEIEGVIVNSPREAIRRGFKIGFVENDPNVLQMLEDRNLSSHTYNESYAEQIYDRLESHLVFFRQTLVLVTKGFSN